MFIALAMVLGVVWGEYLLTRPDPTPPAPLSLEISPIQIRKWMLTQGVQTAWIGHLGNLGSADCFSTEIVGGRHIFSYCKLRKAGFVP